MSRFQIVLLVVFGFFIIVAVLTFALYRGGSAGQVNVTIWGDYTSSDFNSILNNSGLLQDREVIIRYVEKSSGTLEREWTEAVAAGRGPDLVILPHDQVYKNRSKLVPIPYQSISERDFRDTFVEASEVFLAPEGVYALPVSIDPLVLYYNRDILSSSGIPKPISYWDEIYTTATTLTKRDGANNITQSTIALGTTGNIKNAKDILSLLFIQAGSPVTTFVGQGESRELRSALSSNEGLSVRPADAALDFYTQFSNPSKSFYSWNRVLPEAQTNFSSGDAAYYIGFASELLEVRGKSPTLNFSVAPVPQSRVSGRTTTFGRVKGVAISRGTLSPEAALLAGLRLVSREFSTAVTQTLLLPPARRDLLEARPSDSVWPVFYDAALQSKNWLDPSTDETRNTFYSLVESITSGRARTSEAVNQASRELDAIIN